jgi:hypothetical protein
MKPAHHNLIGFACAIGAIGVIAWLCFASWGGMLPF